MHYIWCAFNVEYLQNVYNDSSSLMNLSMPQRKCTFGVKCVQELFDRPSARSKPWVICKTSMWLLSNLFQPCWSEKYLYIKNLMVSMLSFLHVSENVIMFLLQCKKRELICVLKCTEALNLNTSDTSWRASDCVLMPWTIAVTAFKSTREREYRGIAPHFSTWGTECILWWWLTTVGVKIIVAH